MKAHKGFEENPGNSRQTVFEVIELEFGGKYSEATLLSEFITLLGNEEEEWGGVAAMRLCLKEWKKEHPQLNEKNSTFKDFETFLFSPDRNVIDIQGTSKEVVPPANPKKLKGPDRQSSSKTVNPDAVDLPKNPTTLKEADKPSTSKQISQGAIGPPIVPPAYTKTLKGADKPSTSKPVSQGATGQPFGPPAYPKKLKVKIYMGTGWDRLPRRDSGSPPSLFVNLMIHDCKSEKTAVQKEKSIPCWGEEFEFPLPRPTGAMLIVEVTDHHLLHRDQFAGKFCLSLSDVKSGIQVIRLTSEGGMTLSSAQLLVRIMLV